MILGDAAATCIPPSILLQPASQTVVVGSTVTFTVAATGTPPLSYLWFRNGTLVGGGLPSYTTPAAKTTDRGPFKIYCIVTDSCGSVQSSNAILTVSCGPFSITTQPASQTVRGRSSTFDTAVIVSFSVVAAGVEPLTYQWQTSDCNGLTWVIAQDGFDTACCYQGATTPTFTTPEITTKYDGYLIRCIVKDACGTADTSQAARLTVTTDTCIWATSQPRDRYVKVGDTATFSVSAAGALPRTLQWFQRSDLVPYGGSTAASIQGATSGSYTATATSMMLDTATGFYCMVSGPCGSPVQMWAGYLYAIPCAPTTPNPPNGAANESQDPVLGWSAPGAKVCTLQVSTAKDFSSNDSIFTVIGTDQPLSLSVNTTYYWRVNASNQNGSSGYSATWSFTTALWPPAAPILMRPAYGEPGVNPTPTLAWTSVKNASAYRAQVSTINDFSTILFDDSALTADSVKPGTLANDSTYYWRVCARDAAGTGPWSLVSRFAVASTASRWAGISGIHQLRVFFSPRSSTSDLMIAIPESYLPETEVTLSTIAGKIVGQWRLLGTGLHRISIGGHAQVTGVCFCRITNGNNSVVRKLPALSLH